VNAIAAPERDFRRNLKEIGRFKSLEDPPQKEPIMAQGQGTSVSRGTSNRGFASMDPQKQREIARKGGESVPNEKRSFSQDRELAAQAGRKGGEASQGARRKTT
jgi:general stress protein YciG